MIDFHTHILPGIDDGSRDADMTDAMLREEKKQGVNFIVATPHFYAYQMSMEKFLERRAAALEQTERLRRKAETPLPSIAAGAEVFYFEGIGRAESIARLCVEGTRTLLVEMPFEQWSDDVLRDIESLIVRQELKVVLAHVERYIGFQKNRRVWDRVMALPLTPQINAGSFLKSGGFFHPNRKRKFCLEFLEEHPYTILGSDCHNMAGRAPNLASGRTEIAAALGEEELACIDSATESALMG